MIRELTENAQRVLEARYLSKNVDGDIIEDWDGLCKRVASFIASAEKDPDDERTLATEFHKMLFDRTFLPNSPTLFNAGKLLGNLSGCFVLPIEDSLTGIFESLTNAVMVFRTGGGCGYDFSDLRKSGSPVSMTSGVSSGPISFISVFNAATEVIKQGGKRRGANMGVLRVDHPDIELFLDAKKEEGDLANFNLSVALTDTFMRAVSDGLAGKCDDFELLDRYTDSVDRVISALEIFNRLVEGAWSNGEPGLLFIDEMNRKHPLKGLGSIKAVNPCIGEGTLVSTSKGLIPIEDIKVGDLILTREGKFVSVLRHINNGVKPVVELKTRHGFRIKVTPEHKMWTPIGWFVADQCLDRCLVLQRAAAFGTHSMDKDLAELLGFWFGDGSAGKRVQFAFGHDEFLANKYRDILNSQFTCKTNITIGRGNNLIPNLLVTTGKSNVVDFFSPYKYKKEIPSVILRGTQEVQAAFLRGLFAADGHVETAGGMCAIALSCVNEVIVDQVRLMLLNFGIVCSKYRSKNKPVPGNIYNIKGSVCYRIQFAGQFREIFIDAIGTYKRFKSTKKYHLDADADKVVSIKEVGECTVYDLTVDDKTHSFVANGLVVSNCGEQPLLPYESCNLGSINLTHFYYAEGRDAIDWERLQLQVELAVKFLDNVCTMNRFPVPEISEATAKTRKIGLGIMGWADLLILQGISYDSPQACKLGAKLMEFIHYYAVNESCNLAAELEPYPAFGSHYKPIEYNSGNCDWTALQKRIEEHGLRNACVTSIAPTGSISLLAGVSSGIEPNFQWQYSYHRVDQDFDETHWLAEGYLTQALNLPEFFQTSLDIAPQDHIKMQAAFQPWVDSGISKTINMVNEATRSVVADAILLAWRSGLKGLTLYRSGSRRQEVIVAKSETKEAVPEELTHGPRKRPEITDGRTMKVSVGDDCGSMYVTLNTDTKGPCESFITLGRSGGCINSHVEALGRIISLALRSAVPISEILEQLKGIRCSKVRRLKDGDALRSCPDAVAYAFNAMLAQTAEGDHPLDDSPEILIKKGSAVQAGENPDCPDCSSQLEIEGHCLSCRCGYTKCG